MMIDLFAVILATAVLGLVAGIFMIHRISTVGDEAVARWRYRDEWSGDEIGAASEPARSDLEAARMIGRLLILIAVMAPLIFLVLWVAAPPAWPQPMFYEPPWYEGVLPWVGAGGYVVGLAWMIRIYRADPEPDQRSWRYRS
jgi:hypothetical protein